MTSLPSNPSVLLHHDGELADVRRLLDELRAQFVERVGTTDDVVDATDWDVIIATPRQILRVRGASARPRPKLIVVLEGDSRTLRSHLRRMRVDMMVRRPVHPAALRLLVLHTLYRGPERRRRERVSIGAEISIRTGLLPHTATLTELSMRGCRLLCDRQVERGRSIKLRLPARITGGRPLSVRGSVVRAGPARESSTGGSVVGVRFDELTPKLTLKLQSLLASHQTGPAVLPESIDEGITAHIEVAPPDTTNELAMGQDPPTKPENPTSHEASTTERRAGTRRSYDKRIVALGLQATRVLLGRDISLGGMRVDSDTELAVGDRLQIALHGMNRAEPLVIRAHVERDDPDASMVLCWEELSPQSSADLSQVIEHLPILSGEAGDEDQCGVVISEIIERKAG